MARTARYSKFHFTRIFPRAPGSPPGRFLSAVRLRKAKQLLTSTSLTVTDISNMVGYTRRRHLQLRFAYSPGRAAAHLPAAGRSPALAGLRERSQRWWPSSRRTDAVDRTRQHLVHRCGLRGSPLSRTLPGQDTPGRAGAMHRRPTGRAVGARRRAARHVARGCLLPTGLLQR
ncbi:helix-turn-helix domain-containing protein [Actinoplanes sp. NPDC026623]|uniref:helix-turn-helix domain-containing protein n=1 Tax=Actinoplanes sp. NPDC026623 TaxID=3155610 RepID=UPI0033F323E7